MARFTVTVSIICDTAEQAEQVICERVNYDEDYGFAYTINAESVTSVGEDDDEPICDACGRESLACSLNPCDDVLEDRGEGRCDECGVAIPLKADSLVGTYHERSCSLHPQTYSA